MTSGYERIANYTVVKRIGSGRFGEVFLVKHKKTGQLFCWKVVAYKGLSDKEKQQLVMEVNVIRELNHQNIVKYMDRMIDKERQLLYILMEYCDAGDLGENMRQFYKHYKLVNEQVIFDIALQLIFALAYCHNCKLGTKTGKVLHRDLKPQNIILSTKYNEDGSKSYVCKIGDFGLCRQIGMTSFANSCVGTPYYWCPELLLSTTKNYDDKMDMWALGCVLYELSSGKTPFHYTTTLPELTQEMKQGVPLPLDFRSKKLNYLLSCLLQKDPNKRASALQCMGYSIWTEPAMDLFLGTLSGTDYKNFIRNKAMQEARLAELERCTPKNWYSLLLEAGKQANNNTNNTNNNQTNNGNKNNNKDRLDGNERGEKVDKEMDIDNRLKEYKENDNYDNEDRYLRDKRFKRSSSIQSIVDLSNFQDVYGSDEIKTENKSTPRIYNTPNVSMLEYVKHFQDPLDISKSDIIKNKILENQEYQKISGSWSTPLKRNSSKISNDNSSVETRFSRIDSDISGDSVTTKISKYDSLYLQEYNRKNLEDFRLKMGRRNNTSSPTTNLF